MKKKAVFLVLVGIIIVLIAGNVFWWVKYSESEKKVKLISQNIRTLKHNEGLFSKGLWWSMKVVEQYTTVFEGLCAILNNPWGRLFLSEAEEYEKLYRDSKESCARLRRLLFEKYPDIDTLEKIEVGKYVATMDTIIKGLLILDKRQEKESQQIQ